MSEAHEGHNSAGMIDADALTGYCKRLHSLLDDREALNADIKAVYEEAKEAGFVTARVRQLVKEQRMDQETLRSQLDYMDTLRNALGMLSDTPLGRAAMNGAEQKPKRARGRPRKEKPPTISEALEAAKEHLEGNGNAEPF